MDLNKLNTGEKVTGVSGIVLLVFSFFPWLGFSSTAGLRSRPSKSAWAFTLLLDRRDPRGRARRCSSSLKAAGIELPELGNVGGTQHPRRRGDRRRSCSSSSS